MPEYSRPTSLQIALKQRAEGGWRVAAGCTDLFPAIEAQEFSDNILDVTQIAEMKSIQLGPDGLRIGAAVTWTEIVAADLPPALDGLKQAALEVGSIQIQNAA